MLRFEVLFHGCVPIADQRVEPVPEQSQCAPESQRLICDELFTARGFGDGKFKQGMGDRLIRYAAPLQLVGDEINHTVGELAFFARPEVFEGLIVIHPSIVRDRTLKKQIWKPGALK